MFPHRIARLKTPFLLTSLISDTDMATTKERLPGAMDIVTDRTEAAAEDLARRKREDFNFMVLCAAKQCMGTYHLLRDRSFDKRK